MLLERLADDAQSARIRRADVVVTSSSKFEGQLLVSSPVMGDPNFARTVVFVLSHSSEGSVGVVLNRPGEVPVAAWLPMWEAATPEPRVVFTGGPVDPSTSIGVARAGGRIAMVDLEAGPPTGISDAVRVFSGYAGWGPGQLEMEVSLDAWMVVEARPEDAFCERPDTLWRDVLRRQHSDVALLSAFSEDPSNN